MAREEQLDRWHGTMENLSISSVTEVTVAPYQLRIHNGQGGIEFYNLYEDPGVTNVGNHPENDIILYGKGVAPFHLLLDHRSMPFYVLVLTNEHVTTLNSKPIYVNQAQPIADGTTLHVAGYTMILFQHNDK